MSIFIKNKFLCFLLVFYLSLPTSLLFFILVSKNVFDKNQHGCSKNSHEKFLAFVLHAGQVDGPVVAEGPRPVVGRGHDRGVGGHAAAHVAVLVYVLDQLVRDFRVDLVERVGHQLAARLYVAVQFKLVEKNI